MHHICLNYSRKTPFCFIIYCSTIICVICDAGNLLGIYFFLILKIVKNKLKAVVTVCQNHYGRHFPTFSNSLLITVNYHLCLIWRPHDSEIQHRQEKVLRNSQHLGRCQLIARNTKLRVAHRPRKTRPSQAEFSACWGSRKGLKEGVLRHCAGPCQRHHQK